MKKIAPPLEIDEIIDDFHTLKHYVTQNGYNLKFGSERLKDNDDIAQIALKSNSWSCKFVSQRIRNNRDYAMACLKANADALECFPQFNDDIELIKIALEGNGANMEFSSPSIQDSFYFAKIAIKDNNAYGVRYISKRLKQSYEIALIVAEQSIDCLKYMSDEIQDFYEKYKNSGVQFIVNQLRKKILESNLSSKEYSRTVKI